MSYNAPPPYAPPIDYSYLGTQASERLVKAESEAQILKTSLEMGFQLDPQAYQNHEWRFQCILQDLNWVRQYSNDEAIAPWVPNIANRVRQ